VDKGRNLPEVVASIVWARQLRARVEGMLDACDGLLGDLGGSGGGSDLATAALALHGELTAYAEDQVDRLRMFSIRY